MASSFVTENAIVAIMLMEDEEEEESVIFSGFRKKNRSVNHIFSRRRSEGAFNLTVERRLFGNDKHFREYFRLSTELFETVLSYVRDDVTKQPYNRRQNPISAKEKLCITLRYMATGESFRSLAFQYRIHHSWISVFVRDVLGSIRKHMLYVCIPRPSEEQMKDNVQDFFNLWNYPNCCASIDGKHIRIRCPNNAGSLFFNYKNFHSIVLLAVVDARYRFVAIDVGSYGREGDAGIFLKSNMRKQMADGSFKIPPPKLLPGTYVELPHVILGDEAFSLTTCMMKPYPQNQTAHDKTKAIYNYRHSRARRTSENAFGILCQYFRVFYTPIAVMPEVCDDLIVSACILHNLLRNSNISYPNENLNTSLEFPKENMIPLIPTIDRRSSFEAFNVRDKFKTYFTSTKGSVEWQNQTVSRVM